MTRSLSANLSDEIRWPNQSPETSPVKWHHAHTTWFFETFVLRPLLSGYVPFHEEFHRLSNSYYSSLEEKIPKEKLRASFFRPSLDQILDYRAHVDHGQMGLIRALYHSFARTNLGTIIVRGQWRCNMTEAPRQAFTPATVHSGDALWGDADRWRGLRLRPVSGGYSSQIRQLKLEIA